MYRTKVFFIIFNILLLIFLLLIDISLIIPDNLAQAQYWAAIPPYNVLWPLFSPVLSPIDPVTGLPTPLVASLTNNTILPVQPALAFDPCQPNVAGMGFKGKRVSKGRFFTIHQSFSCFSPWRKDLFLKVKTDLHLFTIFKKQCIFTLTRIPVLIYTFILIKKKELRDKISDLAADYLFKYNVLLSPVVYSLFEYKENKRLGSFFFEKVEKEGIAL